MSKKKTIALTWGWTGGHIFPLISIHNYLKEEKADYNFLWIGEELELEEEISLKNEIDFHHIATGKIRRYFDFKNFYEPLKNLTGIFQWIYYIWKYKIDIIFSKGGFVSLPLCIAGKIMGKKIYIHESDTVSWLSNKLVSKLATKIFYTFPKEVLSKKEKVTWQILNAELLEWLKNLNLESNEKLKVLVIAWSQGSTIIFKSLLKIIPDLKNITFEIILGTKNLNFRKEFEKLGNTIVHDFVTQKKLGKIYKDTDISITRGWATTLWELYYFWIHSLIVPLKNSAWNHQVKNSDFFNKSFWSDIFDEEKNLSLELFRKLKKYENLRKEKLNLDWFFDAMKIIEKEIK